MHRSDYIPANDGKFLEWVKILFAYAEAHAADFGLDPRGFDNINALIEAYEAAYARAENPNRGRADVVAKNEARDTLKKAVRQYVKEYLTSNHLVTDVDRRHMGLPVHDVKPTPAPVPTDMPVGEVDFSIHQQHRVHVKVGKLTGKAKPPKVHGFEVWRKVGGDPPASDAEWTYVNFASRSPLIIDYPQTDVGKTVYYRFRWVNTRNQPGPWSEGYVSAVIG
ncbi:MAG: hypothetical protein LBJ63_09605 [Prevotellaceae bacterium]|jgi:hypothetical protein|nr:hypothetical protein [Prevotellaceae bacterium]